MSWDPAEGTGCGPWIMFGGLCLLGVGAWAAIIFLVRTIAALFP